MGLYENMLTEQVGKLRLRDPAVVDENATIREAIIEMRCKKLGCAIVVNDRQEPLAMFTESQLTRLLSQRPSQIDDPVREHMTLDWPTVRVTDPIVFVLDALEARNVRFLVVIDLHGKLAGLTGQKGLMEYVADHFPKQVIVQRIGCKPYTDEREGA